MDIKTITQIILFLLGSAVVATLLSNIYTTRLNRKKLVAEATRSALKRVEMYYRVLRREDNKDDAAAIRNMFHDLQEENYYYQALLSVEAEWLGATYTNFIAALRRETKDAFRTAWKNKPLGAKAELEGSITINNENIDRYVSRFTRDGRRFFNPLSRAWMRGRYMCRSQIKDNGYGSD